jgi:hypothetical protein
MLLQVIYEGALRDSRLLHLVEPCRLRPCVGLHKQLGIFEFTQTRELFNRGRAPHDGAESRRELPVSFTTIFC